jgi:hypothetical protein
MPYIKQDERKYYDNIVDHLANCIINSDNDRISGDLNYVLFRLAKKLCDPTIGGTKNYARMAVILSAMNEAQAEFRRRILVPYEDEKINSNGDVI